MFSEEKLSQAGQKNNKVMVQILFTQMHRTVWNMKKKMHQKIIYYNALKKNQSNKGLCMPNTSKFKTSLT